VKKGALLIFLFLVFLLLFGKVIIHLKNSEKHKIEKTIKISDKTSVQTINSVEKEKEKEPSQNTPKPVENTSEKKKLPLSIEIISVLPYEGKSADFIPVIKANSSVETSITTAVKILEERSSLFPTKEDEIEIKLTESKNISKGYPYDVVENSDGSFTIYLSLQKVLYNSIPVYELVASGIAESLLTKNNKNFIKFPRFFRFGISASLSGLNKYIEKQEILEIERDGSLSFSASSETSHPILNGIYLVDFLVENCAGESPKDLLPYFVEETDFIKFLEKSTKFSFGEIEQNYIRYSKNRYSSFTKLTPHFLSIVAQLRNLKEEETLPLLQEFLRTNPTDIHYGEGLYYLGYINYRIGNYSEAEKILNDLLINHSYETVSHGKAHFFLGRCYQLRGYSSLALPEYRYALLGENELLIKVAEKNIKEMSK